MVERLWNVTILPKMNVSASNINAKNIVKKFEKYVYEGHYRNNDFNMKDYKKKLIRMLAMDRDFVREFKKEQTLDKNVTFSDYLSNSGTRYNIFKIIRALDSKKICNLVRQCDHNNYMNDDALYDSICDENTVKLCIDIVVVTDINFPKYFNAKNKSTVKKYEKITPSNCLKLVEVNGWSGYAKSYLEAARYAEDDKPAKYYDTFEICFRKIMDKVVETESIENLEHHLVCYLKKGTTWAYSVYAFLGSCSGKIVHDKVRKLFDEFRDKIEMKLGKTKNIFQPIYDLWFSEVK